MSLVEEKYSSKFEQANSSPTHRGAYYQDDAAERSRVLVEAKYKDTKLFWLVDPAEDRITHAKFFAYGGRVSVAIGQTLSTMVKGLTVDEACSLLGEDVERELRDQPEEPAVPEDKRPAFDAVAELLAAARTNYPEAKAVMLAAASIEKTAPATSEGDEGEELTITEAAWLSLGKDDQIALIDIVLDEQVRPALMADGGNVKVLDVTDGERVLIQYQGACGSCGASVGGTLSFIERALRKGVYNELIVIPNM